MFKLFFLNSFIAYQIDMNEQYWTIRINDDGDGDGDDDDDDDDGGGGGDDDDDDDDDDQRLYSRDQWIICLLPQLPRCVYAMPGCHKPFLQNLPGGCSKASGKRPEQGSKSSLEWVLGHVNQWYTSGMNLALWACLKFVQVLGWLSSHSYWGMWRTAISLTMDRYIV